MKTRSNKSEKINNSMQPMRDSGIAMPGKTPNEPEKNDPTRIQPGGPNDPGKNDPTRIKEPDPGQQPGQPVKVPQPSQPSPSNTDMIGTPSGARFLF